MRMIAWLLDCNICMANTLYTSYLPCHNKILLKRDLSTLQQHTVEQPK